MKPEEGSRAAEPPSATLSPLEQSVLRWLRSQRDLSPEEAVAAGTGLSPEVARGSLQRLRSKRLAIVDEEHRVRWTLSARGTEARSRGLPERRLLNRLTEAGAPLAPAELVPATLDVAELPIAVGVLRRHGRLRDGMPFALSPGGEKSDSPLPEELGLERVGRGDAPGDPMRTELLRRGLIVADRSTYRRWGASPDGKEFPLPVEGQEETGALTPALLREGGWRRAQFRPYDVRATVPFRTGAAPHPVLAFLEEFEELLIGLGFSEMTGPLLETEFWNADVLFMPQEHPARSIQDVFRVSGVASHLPAPDLVDRVAAAHEGRPLPGEAVPLSQGWRVPYDRSIAQRSVLRSQTTSVSARTLSKHPSPPFRHYCIGRNFRPDAVDATHHVEFLQCEGILGDEGVSLRELLGVFRAVADGLGIREVKFRPSYYPFTEPSIDGYVRHPLLGWIEVFPGGLLRPEVLRPLGIQVPVAAWGIGLSRLALVALGTRDIRDLYNDDLARLTGRE